MVLLALSFTWLLLANQLPCVFVQKVRQLEQLSQLLFSLIVGTSHSHRANLEWTKERNERNGQLLMQVHPTQPTFSYALITSIILKKVIPITHWAWQCKAGVSGGELIVTLPWGAVKSCQGFYHGWTACARTGQPFGEEIFPHTQPKPSGTTWGHSLCPLLTLLCAEVSSTEPGFIPGSESPGAFLTWRAQRKFLWGVSPGHQGKIKGLHPYFFTMLQSHHGTQPWQRQGPFGHQLVSDIWVIIPGETQKNSINISLMTAQKSTSFGVSSKPNLPPQLREKLKEMYFHSRKQ